MANLGTILQYLLMCACAGRQAQHTHLLRKGRGRADMGVSLRQGAHTELPIGKNTGNLIFGQALEGKDVKDLLLNVGSGGGAASAPAAGGAAAAGGDAAPEKEEEKEEDRDSV